MPDSDALVKVGLIALACLCFVGVLLVLILVPLHFTYIDRQNIGFKRNTVGGEVDRSKVYSSGRYGWGVTTGRIQFASTYQRVSFTGSNRLSVFTDSGEIAIGVTFYYRLDPSKLGELYENFGAAYQDRIESFARSELRNAATNNTIEAYQSDRNSVANSLFAGLRAALTTKANVEVTRNFFFLEHIDLPDTVLDKKRLVFEQTQLLITQEANGNATEERLLTKQEVNRLRNNITIIQQNATRVADRMVQVASARKFAVVQNEAGHQLSTMATELSITSDNSTASLLRFNTLLGTKDLTLLANVKSVVLKKGT